MSAPIFIHSNDSAYGLTNFTQSKKSQRILPILFTLCCRQEFLFFH